MHPQQIYGDSLEQLSNDFSGLDISFELESNFLLKKYCILSKPLFLPPCILPGQVSFLKVKISSEGISPILKLIELILNGALSKFFSEFSCHFLDQIFLSKFPLKTENCRNSFQIIFLLKAHSLTF